MHLISKAYVSLLFVIMFHKVKTNDMESALTKVIKQAIDIISKRPPKPNQLPCHYDANHDLLQPIEDFQPDDNSIFFHKTSCRGDLNSRQACSIEAAVLAHKRRQVFVIFSGPVTSLSKLRQVNLIPNVYCVRIHLNYTDGEIKNVLKYVYYESGYPKTHASDVLKFVTLSKYGGTYMDTDILVVKPFDALGRTWVGAERDSDPSTGVMDFSNGDTGQKVLGMILDEIVKQGFENWNSAGNNVLKIVLRQHCKFEAVSKLNNGPCNGVKIYEDEVFYPIYYPGFEKYFIRGEILSPEKISKAYAHQMWNGISHRQDIENDSIYAKLAKNYCPKTYLAFGKEFGNK